MYRHTKISDAVVKATAAPATGHLYLRDTVLPGFGVRILATGVKTFIFEAKVEGRFIRRTLGQYPELSVPAARNLAMEDRARVTAARRNGTGDPFTKPQPVLAFGELADRYVTEHSMVARKCWKRDIRRLGLYFGRWRSWRLTDITEHHVAKVHQSIAAERGKIEANRAVELLKAVLNKGIQWGLFDGRNVAAQVTRFKEHSRERFLAPAEIQAVNRALADEPNIYWRTFFTASLALGTRKNELLAAAWKDVNLEQRTISFPHTKNGRAHLLPLSAPLVGMLAALPSRLTSPWVFPGSGHTGHLTEPKKSWQRIKARASIDDCTIHDLRRSLGSLLAAQGADMLLIGRVLNHKSPNATAIYARFGNEPLRAALDQASEVIFGGDHEA